MTRELQKLRLVCFMTCLVPDFFSSNKLAMGAFPFGMTGLEGGPKLVDIIPQGSELVVCFNEPT